VLRSRRNETPKLVRLHACSVCSFGVPCQVPGQASGASIYVLSVHNLAILQLLLITRQAVDCSQNLIERGHMRFALILRCH